MLDSLVCVSRLVGWRATHTHTHTYLTLTLASTHLYTYYDQPMNFSGETVSLVAFQAECRNDAQTQLSLTTLALNNFFSTARTDLYLGSLERALRALQVCRKK